MQTFQIFDRGRLLASPTNSARVPSLPSQGRRQHVLTAPPAPPPTNASRSPHATPPVPAHFRTRGRARDALRWLAGSSQPRPRARAGSWAGARGAAPRGSARDPRSGSGRGVLELLRDSLGPEAPPVPFPASRTAGQRPRTPPAVPGCRGPGNAGLKDLRSPRPSWAA